MLSPPPALVESFHVFLLSLSFLSSVLVYSVSLCLSLSLSGFPWCPSGFASLCISVFLSIVLPFCPSLCPYSLLPIMFSGQLLSQLCFLSQLSVMGLLNSVSPALVCVCVCVCVWLRVCVYRAVPWWCLWCLPTSQLSTCERQKVTERWRRTLEAIVRKCLLSPSFPPPVSPVSPWVYIVCSLTVASLHLSFTAIISGKNAS